MISNNYANKILNTIVGYSDSISMPSVVYLGLCTTEPNRETGAVSDEPPTQIVEDDKTVTTGYQRKKVGGSTLSSDSKFGVATNGKIINQNEIQMKTARRPWGKLNYWFLSESASGGVANIWGEVKGVDENGEPNEDVGIEVGINTVPTFYEGNLKASIDVSLTDDETEAT